MKHTLRIASVYVVTVYGIVWCLSQLLSFTPTFPYASTLLTQYGPRWLTTMAHFDGVHYLTIIEEGYEGTGLIQAFFPLYPLLVKLLTFNIFNPLYVGLLVSFFSILGTGYFLHRLFRSKDLLLLMLCLPTAFFLAGLYTESLFLMLSLAAYSYAKERHFVVAGCFGFLAGLTRLQGFLLAILLLFEVRRTYAPKSAYIWALMPVFGLFTYMTYLWFLFGDPVLFLSVQREFGAQRGAGVLIPVITPLIRYLKIFMSVPVWSHAYFVALQEFLIAVGGFGLAAILLKRKEFGLGLYALSSLLLPTLTGTLSSMPRYVLVIFPLFLVLSQVLTGRKKLVTLIIFAILQVINLALFTQGLWVA
jgi:Gpi18-like mannosyltransferase